MGDALGVGEAGFAGAQGGFGLLSVCDVLDRAGDVERVDGGLFVDCAVAAVGEYKPVLDAVRLLLK